MKKIAINGFGRIGRMVFRKLLQTDGYEVVAINASYSSEQLAHLIQYDSVHGHLDCSIDYDDCSITVNGKQIELVNCRIPKELPWERLKIDVVVEATGAFRTVSLNEGHLEAGAKHVVVTAPAKDEMKMIVMGVNEETYNGERIVSNASCTTNCLAPVAQVLEKEFGIANGLMTTIHSYTNDQRIIDNPHKDLRRSRAAGTNMIPTSTGAAKALGEIIPSLKGKLNGTSVRVPTTNVSLVDLVVDLKKSVTVEELNGAFEKAASAYNSVLDFNKLPLVSSDYMTNPYSAVVDGLSTMVIEGRKVKVLAWYDNEWGYSSRVVDLVKYISCEKSE